jgi:LCP family protein required for cell wall assembly
VRNFSGRGVTVDPPDEPTGAESEAERQPRVARGQARRRARRRTWRRRILWGSAAAVAVVLGVTVAGSAHLNANIKRVDISGALGSDRPTPTVTASGPNQPMNILVMGSDDRVGLDERTYGSDTVEGGAHSDTNLLVHLSADRTWAMVVSIPRDSMVRSPKDCKDAKTPVADGVIRQWNHNYTDGGPACVIRTLEYNTGVFVDHFVVVNFDGFKNMVDALGGVDVCLSKDVVDADSQFRLSAGMHVVNGTTALGYVRVRKTLGDGSDLGRIKRQQAFLSSVIQKVTKSSMLLRPDRLYAFLDAATQSITTDKGMSVGTMKDIAGSVAGIGLDKITFYTVPTEQYPADHNRVQWTSGASQLWTAMTSDKRIGAAKSTTPTPTSTSTVPLTVSPKDITVRVVNESGVSGVAIQAADALRVQGFAGLTTVTGAGGVTSGASIAYGPGHQEAARTVAAAFPGAKVVVDASVGSAIVVHLGLDSPFVVAVPNRLGTQPLPTPSVTPTDSSQPTITGRVASTNICQ